MNDLISKEMAAALVNVSTRWLDLLHKKGEGPARYKIGMHVRYSRAAVEAWLEQQR